MTRPWKVKTCSALVCPIYVKLADRGLLLGQYHVVSTELPDEPASAWKISAAFLARGPCAGVLADIDQDRDGLATGYFSLLRHAGLGRGQDYRGRVDPGEL